jgi:hypothetical protein
MTLHSRTQALLDLVEQDRRAQCAAILQEAQADAAARLAQARSEARARVREAFAEERQRAQTRLDAARATLQTRLRLHEQRHASAWLSLGWQRLPQALRERWRDQTARGLWVQAALAAARRVLPAGPWRIVHAEGWPVTEREALTARLREELGSAPVFTLDAALDAGLRIGANGNRVDATLAGLTAERDEIGARLLALLGDDAGGHVRSTKGRQ